jgi:hypothetical protein
MSHRASFAKHTSTISKACSKILWHYYKVWKKNCLTDFDIQKMIDTNASTITYVFENPSPPLTKIIFDIPVGICSCNKKNISNIVEIKIKFRKKQNFWFSTFFQGANLIKATNSIGSTSKSCALLYGGSR